MITQDRLKELLHYCPETGVFTWKIPGRGRQKNKYVGSINGAGYLDIRLDYDLYRSHRLAWLYVYGEFPLNGIDHINGVITDNRIVNLREATNSQNQQNLKKCRKHNASGFLGAHFDKQRGKYKAVIDINKKRYELGFFSTPEEAHEVYLKAKIELHPFNTIQIEV